MSASIESIQFRGIPALRLSVGGATAVVSLFGAQVLSWVTTDGRERLFLSDQARFDGQTPIRGGVPVCFPQFAEQGGLPKHGLVRTRSWELDRQHAGDDYALVNLVLADDAETRDIWPYAFRLEMTVMLERDRLDLELGVENTGSEDFAFTGALHSYLRVTQVEDVALSGLYGFHYRDATRGGQEIRETGTHLSVEAETDRLYQRVNRPLLLEAGNLSMGIQQDGFTDVVVWNPWVERCAALPDMTPESWRHMLCVEAAVAGRPVTVPAGESWSGRQTLVPV